MEKAEGSGRAGAGGNQSIEEGCVGVGHEGFVVAAGKGEAVGAGGGRGVDGGGDAAGEVLGSSRRGEENGVGLELLAAEGLVEGHDGEAGGERFEEGQGEGFAGGGGEEQVGGAVPAGHVTGVGGGQEEAAGTEQAGAEGGEFVVLGAASEDDEGAVRTQGGGADQDVHALEGFEGPDGEGHGAFEGVEGFAGAVRGEAAEVDADGDDVGAESGNLGGILYTFSDWTFV